MGSVWSACVMTIAFSPTGRQLAPPERYAIPPGMPELPGALHVPQKPLIVEETGDARRKM